MAGGSLSDIKLTPRQTLIALFFIALILACLGLRLYYSNQALELGGPEFTVAGQDTVLSVYRGKLYRIDRLGEILQHINLKDIGIQDRVVDLQLLDDGRFVIGDWDNHRILLCSFEGSACQTLTRDLQQHVRNYFKFEYQAAQHLIYISDTDRHRILLYDTDSHSVQTVSAPKQVLFPNHLVREADGLLYVTDTNHHRIAALSLQEGRRAELAREYRIPSGVSRKRWPISFCRMPNGDLYVLQANGALQHADLVWLPAGGAARKLSIPAHAELSDISRMGQTLIFNDAKQTAIYAMNTPDHSFHVFGGESLLTMFRQDHQRKVKYEFISSAMLAAMFAILFAMVGFIIYLVAKGRRVISQARVEISELDLPPVVPGRLTWVAGNAKLRKLVPILLLLIILSGGMLFMLMRMMGLDLLHAAADSREQKLFFLLLCLGVIFVMLLVNAVFNLYTRVGTDGIAIYIDRLLKTYKINPRIMLYSDHYLLAKNLIIPYRNIFMQSFSNQRQFEAYILPLLKAHARKIRTFRDVPFYMLRHPTLMGLFNTLALVLVVYFLYRSIRIDMLLKGP